MLVTGGVEVVLGLGVRCPWCCQGLFCYFYGAVFCARGALPPLSEGVFSLFSIHLALAQLAFCFKNKTNHVCNHMLHDCCSLYKYLIHFQTEDSCARHIAPLPHKSC